MGSKAAVLVGAGAATLVYMLGALVALALVAALELAGFESVAQGLADQALALVVIAALVAGGQTVANVRAH